MMHSPEIPTDRQTWESPIAYYWWEDEILISLSKSTLRTVETIKANVAIVQTITGNKPTSLLIYLSKSPIPDKETQSYSKTQLPLIYSSMAMVSKPGLAQFIMRLLFSFQKPPIPMKSFADAEKAKRWLRSH